MTNDERPFERIQEDNIGAFILSNSSQDTEASFTVRFDRTYLLNGKLNLTELYRKQDLATLRKVVELAEKRLADLESNPSLFCK